MRSFKTLQIQDEVVKRFQDNVRDAVEPLLRCVLTDGNLCKTNISASDPSPASQFRSDPFAVFLKAGQDNFISHGLGRDPNIWIVVRKYQQADIWEEEVTGPSVRETMAKKQRVINLQCSADCVVRVWVS